MPTSRVFIPQRPLMKVFNNETDEWEWVNKWDLSEAENYGTITPILSSQARPFTPEPIIAEIKAALHDYGDSDYLIAIGNPALLAWCVAIAAYFNDGFVNMLQWNSIDRTYVSIEADLGMR